MTAIASLLGQETAARLAALVSEPVRLAKRNGTCGAPGCCTPIYQGVLIVKPPGQAWRHVDCTRPGRRSKADRDAEHDRIASGGRRRR